MSYKLAYLNLAGRAEPIRWIFVAAGEEYEGNIFIASPKLIGYVSNDVRIQREE